jgi:hypothetical protein
MALKFLATSARDEGMGLLGKKKAKLTRASKFDILRKFAQDVASC